MTAQRAFLILGLTFFSPLLLHDRVSAQSGTTGVIPSTQGSVFLTDVATSTLIGVINDIGSLRELRHAAITPDGAFAYITSPFPAPHGIVVVNLATNKVSGFIEVPGLPWDIAITPNGRFAYVTKWAGGVDIIDLASNAVTGHIVGPHGLPDQGTFGIDIAPDGDVAYVTILGENPVYNLFEIKLSSNTVGDTFRTGGETALVSSTIGRQVAVTRTKVVVTDPLGDTVDVFRRGNFWDEDRQAFVSLTLAATIVAGDLPFNVAVTPDENKAYVTNVNGQSLSVINLLGPTRAATLPLGGAGLAVAVSPDGSLAYATTFSGTRRLSVINTATDSIRGEIFIAGGDLWDIAFRGVSSAVPVLKATKRDQIRIDANGDGFVNPGDRVRYSVGVSNTGGPASGVSFSDFLDTNTRLVPGTVTTTQGVVVSGNNTGERLVEIDIGTVGASAQLTITFDADVLAPLPLGVNRLTNQGTLHGDNFTTVQTDDPDDQTSGADPTVTFLSLTAQQQIESIRLAVDVVEMSGVLNRGQARSLVEKLNGALMQLANGRTVSARNLLRAFIQEVTAFAANGILTAGQAAILIGAAQATIDRL